MKSVTEIAEQNVAYYAWELEDRADQEDVIGVAFARKCLTYWTGVRDRHKNEKKS